MELATAAKELQSPLDLVRQVAADQKLPVVLFCAGGIATPADASLVMQLGAEGVFVGSGIFKSEDPARMANAIVQATTFFDDPKKIAEVSKGLGAPVGSVVVSTAENIARARVLRKRLGGGWRQAGMLAAACLYALDHHVQRLADDHAAALIFAEAVASHVSTAVEPDGVETNVVVIDTGATAAAPLAAAAAERGVQVSALGPFMIRAVTHLDVTADDCELAGQLVGKLLAG